MMKTRLLPLRVHSLLLAAAMLAVAAIANSVQANSGQHDPQATPPTAITGRVITSDGSPATGFTVVLRRLGEDVRGSGYQRIGPDGKFSFDSLAGGTYTLLAFNENSQEIHFDLRDDGGPALHRPGDIVDFAIKREKPGVITGTVTTQNGEPVVEAIIHAIRVRDSEGNPSVSPFNLPVANAQRKTDDRGVYRLWGLEPGSYVISAGGKSRGLSMLSAYDSDAPTYYTDSSSGSPSPVGVGPGQEVAGIDIQYRGGSGHKIQGLYSASYASGAQGPRQVDSEGRNLVVVLTDALTGEERMSGIDAQAADPGSFEFSEITDGEYEVLVVSFRGPGASEAASESRRITVKGADVNGIRLKPVTFGIISGRIAVEPSPDLKAGCLPKQAPKLNQAAVMCVFSQTGQPRASRPWSLFSPSSSIQVGVDVQGNFPPTKLEPGPYRIKTYLPDDTLYLNSITLGDPSKPAPTGAPAKPVPLGPLFSMKEGQQISPLTISLGLGAARVTGHIIAPPSGALLPAVLEVYLVPTLSEHADNPLRYAMARVRSDGAFVLANITPGRYRILARPGTKDSDQPLIESKDGRAALRRDAERTGSTLELATCQKLDGYALVYTP